MYMLLSDFYLHFFKESKIDIKVHPLCAQAQSHHRGALWTTNRFNQALLFSIVFILQQTEKHCLFFRSRWPLIVARSFLFTFNLYQMVVLIFTINSSPGVK